MDPKIRTVLDAALALPEDDRAAIAHTLLATLAPDVEEIDDEALLAELERRSEEARRDPSATISWGELKNELSTPEGSNHRGSQEPEIANVRFQLDIDRRNISDEALLRDLIQVAARCGNQSPTTEQYCECGLFYSGTIIRRFKGWRKALLKAGLTPVHHNGGLDPDEALTDLKDVARRLGRETITNAEYQAHGRFSPAPFVRMFGSWNKALSAAGLQVSKIARIPDEELFENLERIWRTLGRQPNYGEIQRPLSHFSSGVYTTRFGGWRRALEAFVAFANDKADAELARGDTETEESPSRAPEQVPRRRLTSRVVNWRLRFLIMQRDGFRCRACGASPATTPNVRLHVDHVLPWSAGGETALENLQTLCEPCNIGKSNIAGDEISLPDST